MASYVEYNFSPYVCAALCGNFWQESGINPGIWQGLSAATYTTLLVGYGLGQWTNTGGNKYGRLYKLHRWLVNNGYSSDDGDGQLEYLIAENTWYTNSAYDFSSLGDFLTTDSEDIETLTHAFNLCWEGIQDSSWDTRVDYANTCYEYIIEHAEDESITTWYKGNEYLSESARLNNAVLLYRHLGSGWQNPSVKKKHKLWLYNRPRKIRII